MPSHYTRQQGRRTGHSAAYNYGYTSPVEDDSDGDSDEGFDPDAALDSFINANGDEVVVDEDGAYIDTSWFRPPPSTTGEDTPVQRIVRTRAQARREAEGAAMDEARHGGAEWLNQDSTVITIDGDGSNDNNGSPAAKRRRTMNDSQQPSTSAGGVNQSPAVSTASQSDSDSQCIICFMPFSTSGDHRVAALKCGHLFGKNCIEQWIRQERKKALCPVCKKHARLCDVIPLFVKCVKAVDSAELDDLRSINTGLLEENTRLKEENLMLNAVNEEMETRCEEIQRAARLKGGETAGEGGGGVIADRLRQQIVKLQARLKDSEQRAANLETRNRELTVTHQRAISEAEADASRRRSLEEGQQRQQRSSILTTGSSNGGGGGGTSLETINDRLRQQIKKLQERYRQIIQDGGGGERRQ